MIKLPQRIDFARESTLGGLALRVTAVLDDLIDYLRGVPTFEFVVFETDATGADYVITQVEPVTGVVWVQGVDARGEPLDTGTIAWTQSDDVRKPGIKVTVTGPTPGEQSSITLLVLGRG